MLDHPVNDTEGNKIGEAKHVFLDDVTGRPAWGSVKTILFRHQRVVRADPGRRGCDHFRADASYLPELKAYLDELRRTKERVLAATGLDDWAREKALPSEEEIARVKHLIARVEDDLDQLTDTERHELEEAITLVRRSRRVVSLGMPHVRQPSPDLRLERPRPRKPRESCRHAAPSSTGTVTSSA